MAKNLDDDDEQKIYENLTQLNKSRQKSIANSTQKSTANSKREEHTHLQVRIKRTERECELEAETYEENNVSKREFGR